MRSNTPLLLMNGALTLTVSLLAWQVWSTHQLEAQLQTLQQQYAQGNFAPLNSAVAPSASANQGLGNINPLALGGAGNVNPPPAAIPVHPPGGSSIQPGAIPDPFDSFFSGTSDPFADFDQMRQQMLDRMQQLMGGNPGSLFDFDSLDPFGNSGAFGNSVPGTGFNSAAITGNGQPDITVSEQPDAYIVTITVPQGSNIELNTSVENTQLNIEGKLTIEEKSNTAAGSYSSVQTRQFARSLPLPEDVDPLGISNETRDNQVIITLPKTG